MEVPDRRLRPSFVGDALSSPVVTASSPMRSRRSSQRRRADSRSGSPTASRSVQLADSESVFDFEDIEPLDDFLLESTIGTLGAWGRRETGISPSATFRGGDTRASIGYGILSSALLAKLDMIETRGVSTSQPPSARSETRRSPLQLSALQESRRGRLWRVARSVMVLLRFFALLRELRLSPYCTDGLGLVAYVAEHIASAASGVVPLCGALRVFAATPHNARVLATPEHLQAVVRAIVRAVEAGRSRGPPVTERSTDIAPATTGSVPSEAEAADEALGLIARASHVDAAAHLVEALAHVLRESATARAWFSTGSDEGGTPADEALARALLAAQHAPAAARILCAAVGSEADLPLLAGPTAPAKARSYIGFSRGCWDVLAAAARRCEATVGALPDGASASSPLTHAADSLAVIGAVGAAAAAAVVAVGRTDPSAAGLGGVLEAVLFPAAQALCSLGQRCCFPRHDFITSGRARSGSTPSELSSPSPSRRRRSSAQVFAQDLVPACSALFDPRTIAAVHGHQGSASRGGFLCAIADVAAAAAVGHGCAPLADVMSAALGAAGGLFTDDAATAADVRRLVAALHKAADALHTPSRSTVIAALAASTAAAAWSLDAADRAALQDGLIGAAEAVLRGPPPPPQVLSLLATVVKCCNAPQALGTAVGVWAVQCLASAPTAADAYDLLCVAAVAADNVGWEALGAVRVSTAVSRRPSLQTNDEDEFFIAEDDDDDVQLGAVLAEYAVSAAMNARSTDDVFCVCGAAALVLAASRSRPVPLAVAQQLWGAVSALAMTEAAAAPAMAAAACVWLVAAPVDVRATLVPAVFRTCNAVEAHHASACASDPVGVPEAQQALQPPTSCLPFRAGDYFHDLPSADVGAAITATLTAASRLVEDVSLHGGTSLSGSRSQLAAAAMLEASLAVLPHSPDRAAVALRLAVAASATSVEISTDAVCGLIAAAGHAAWTAAAAALRQPQGLRPSARPPSWGCATALPPAVWAQAFGAGGPQRGVGLQLAASVALWAYTCQDAAAVALFLVEGGGASAAALFAALAPLGTMRDDSGHSPGAEAFTDEHRTEVASALRAAAGSLSGGSEGLLPPACAFWRRCVQWAATFGRSAITEENVQLRSFTDRHRHAAVLALAAAEEAAREAVAVAHAISHQTLDEVFGAARCSITSADARARVSGLCGAEAQARMVIWADAFGASLSVAGSPPPAVAGPDGKWQQEAVACAAAAMLTTHAQCEEALLTMRELVANTAIAVMTEASRPPPPPAAPAASPPPPSANPPPPPTGMGGMAHRRSTFGGFGDTVAAQASVAHMEKLLQARAAEWEAEAETLRAQLLRAEGRCRLLENNTEDLHVLVERLKKDAAAAARPPKPPTAEAAVQAEAESRVAAVLTTSTASQCSEEGPVRSHAGARSAPRAAVQLLAAVQRSPKAALAPLSAPAPASPAGDNDLAALRVSVGRLAAELHQVAEVQRDMHRTLSTGPPAQGPVIEARTASTSRIPSASSSRPPSPRAASRSTSPSPRLSRPPSASARSSRLPSRATTPRSQPLPPNGPSPARGTAVSLLRSRRVASGVGQRPRFLDAPVPRVSPVLQLPSPMELFCTGGRAVPWEEPEGPGGEEEQHRPRTTPARQAPPRRNPAPRQFEVRPKPKNFNNRRDTVNDVGYSGPARSPTRR